MRDWPRRILVCGSRDWADVNTIASSLRFWRQDFPQTVIHGAASRKLRGVEESADMLADAVARELGYDVEPHPADWRLHGRAAGFIRNVEMLETGIDLVSAFQRNSSRGTQHTIDEAERRGIATEVHVDDHYSGSLDHQPTYVRAIRSALDETRRP